MSANKNEDGMDQAQAARRQAEELLDQARSQRPQVKDLSERAAWLIRQNNFQALITQEFGRSA